MLSVATAAVMARCCLGWFTRDPHVIAEAATAAPTIVVFGALYALYLTLEGLAIALQKLRACLLVSLSLALAGGLSLRWLTMGGKLTLAGLWASQAGLLAIAAAAIGAAACTGLVGRSRATAMAVG